MYEQILNLYFTKKLISQWLIKISKLFKLCLQNKVIQNYSVVAILHVMDQWKIILSAANYIKCEETRVLRYCWYATILLPFWKLTMVRKPIIYLVYGVSNLFLGIYIGIYIGIYVLVYTFLRIKT